MRETLFQFQIEDDLNAARRATQAFFTERLGEPTDTNEDGALIWKRKEHCAGNEEVKKVGFVSA